MPYPHSNHGKKISFGGNERKSLEGSKTVGFKMGKIKSKMIKRTTNELIKRGIQFSSEFDDNKKILGNTMPSKKLRNKMAGYIARIKKQESRNKLPTAQPQ